MAVVEVEILVGQDRMEISLSKSRITKYLKNQLEYNFPDEDNLDRLDVIVSEALTRVEYCFEHSIYPLNWRGNQCYFNHLNADQYVIFLYFASNIAFQEFGNIELASKLFYLNKIMHSFHCMYDTKLPDIFLVIHGIGAVLGKANYGDYFVVTQGCTVGSNTRSEKPCLGKYVIMYPGSSVIGNTILGDNTCIANGSFVNDERIDCNSLVIGKSPNLVIKPNRYDRLSNFYHVP